MIKSNLRKSFFWLTIHNGKDGTALQQENEVVSHNQEWVEERKETAIRSKFSRAASPKGIITF